MKRTEFGKALASIRVENDLLLAEFAEMIGVNASYLSNVEHGRKQVPIDWFERISERCKLSLGQKSMLLKSYMKAEKEHGVLVTVNNEPQVRVLVAFEESKNELNDEKAEAIEKLLLD